jgi:hypothetical protein
LGFKGNALLFLCVFGSGLVLNLQEEDEASDDQGKQEHIESKGCLFHQIIPSLEEGVLDAVQIQDVDKMVHCLSSH